MRMQSGLDLVTFFCFVFWGKLLSNFRIVSLNSDSLEQLVFILLLYTKLQKFLLKTLLVLICLIKKLRPYTWWYTWASNYWIFKQSIFFQNDLTTTTTTTTTTATFFNSRLFSLKVSSSRSNRQSFTILILINLSPEKQICLQAWMDKKATTYF